MQSLHHPTFAGSDESAGRHHDPSRRALDRVIRGLASAFRPRPDQSLVNAKFTDALERELAGDVRRTGYW
jgi:hypothetical protein